MQVDNNQRIAIMAVSTVAGAGAGTAIGHYMPLVNAKSEANADRFVKEVIREVDATKAKNMLVAAGAKDYLDTIYLTNGGSREKQIDKFFSRFGQIFGINKESVDKMEGLNTKEKLYKIVNDRIDANGQIKMSESDKYLYDTISINGTTEAEAKSLIKDGFKKQKLVEKAGENISEEGLSALKRAMKTIKNERMIKGGLLGAALALATAAIVTCQKD